MCLWSIPGNGQIASSRNAKKLSIKKAQAEAAFIARREIFNQGAPKLWPAVREAFNRFCNAYNEKRDVLYCADVGSRTFIVKNGKIFPMW